ncbi:MAG: RNA polymerase sigma factor [Cytophagales bacterium]|nr:RNA polymerase sigma factor [Cytophagales bacterium]
MVTNPLHTDYDSDKDRSLIDRTLKGDRKALNELLENHNTFIYNIAIKMTGDLELSKDLTQDILIKIVSNLSKYDPGKGDFRPWLYRLAFNHLLDQKKSATELRISSFSQLFGAVESIPDESLEPNQAFPDENHAYTLEVQIKCTSGMLMCLTRDQRLLYVVGDLFQIDHNLGAEIFDLTKESFRKRLSRIRNELHQWMHNRCGLINKDNPCRCNKKTRGFIDRGIVDPGNLIWNKDYKHRIEDYTRSQLHELQRSSDEVYSKLYRRHPMKSTQTVDEVMNTILGDKHLKQMLEI